MTFNFVLAALMSLALTFVAVTLVGAGLAKIGFPLPEANGRIGRIDGLRGYLATAVFACHFLIVVRMVAFGLGWEGVPVTFFGQLGTGGVTLFFMTTGLVFYPRIRQGFQACDWPAIYISRGMRILPLATFSFLAVTAIIMAHTGQRPDAAWVVAAPKWILGYASPDILGYPKSFVVNGGVTWSLWYEWLFYLFVLPGCALAADLLRGRAPSWTVPAGLLIGGFLVHPLFGAKLPMYLPLFALGMLALEVSRTERLRAFLCRRDVAVVALAGLATGLALFDQPFFFALPLYALFFFAVASGNSFFGAFGNRGALVLGECSFSIYLLHPIVLYLLTNGHRAPASVPASLLCLTMPLVGAVVTLAAAATYLLIERPAIGLGRIIIRAWRQRNNLCGLEVEVAP